jgi:hypothetical protein
MANYTTLTTAQHVTLFRGSEAQQPVLRPEVQRLLIEEFYPPLSTSTAPANPGRIIVKAAEVRAWTDYNLKTRSELLSQIGGSVKRRAALAAAALAATSSSGDTL